MHITCVMRQAKPANGSVDLEINVLRVIIQIGYTMIICYYTQPQTNNTNN